MKLSNKYIALEKVIKEHNPDEFGVVELIDDSVYRGRVKYLPTIPVFLGDYQVKLGDIVVFAKYSPNTQDIEDIKYVALEDLIYSE
jgi:hypothetical protein